MYKGLLSATTLGKFNKVSRWKSIFGKGLKFRYRYILPHLPHISGRAELTRLPTDVMANSTPSKLDLAGNDLNLIYDVWKDAAIKNWHDRYLENAPSIEAEVFSPASCAVYLVPGTARNPIDIVDPNSLKWIPGDVMATRGKGMESKYKRKPEVGGDRSKCSWVSIKRVNGSKSNPQCQEMVCIFMGDSKSSLRSQFLADLAKIPGAAHLFGRQPS